MNLAKGHERAGSTRLATLLLGRDIATVSLVERPRSGRVAHRFATLPQGALSEVEGRMVPGVGVETPRVARPEPRSSGGPAPLIARAIVLARRGRKPCALAAPHDRGSTSPDPPPRVGSTSFIWMRADRHTGLPSSSWCRGWESNPHGPCSPMDFESIASASSATPANAFLL